MLALMGGEGRLGGGIMDERTRECLRMGRSFGTGHGSLPNRESSTSQDLRVHLRNWARNDSDIYIYIYTFYYVSYIGKFLKISNLFLWLSIYNELFKNFVIVIIGEFPYNFVLQQWQNYTSKDRVYDKFSLRWLVIKYQFKNDWKTSHFYEKPLSRDCLKSHQS